MELLSLDSTCAWNVFLLQNVLQIKAKIISESLNSSNLYWIMFQQNSVMLKEQGSYFHTWSKEVREGNIHCDPSASGKWSCNHDFAKAQEIYQR
jgi:hypothetical protein